MKITTQEFEKGQAVLQIEVEPPEMEKSLEDAYRKVAKKVNIPGFRKGKIPRTVLENYVGKEGLKQEALEDLIPQLCDQAIEEQKLDVIAQPQAEILELDPVVFKATFPLRPKVDAGDYRSIRLDREPVEVAPEDIDNAIERLRDQNAAWVPVDRPVQFGDLVTVDLEQRLQEGEPLSYEGQQLPVVEDSPLPLPGFSEQLVGMQKNEEKEFTLSFPEDHEMTQIAGQEYGFKVKATEIKEKALPDLDDEFVKSLNQDVESVDALRESVARRLKDAAEESSRRQFEEQVVKAAVEMASVEYPPILEDRETESLLGERDNMLRAQGGLETYLKTINKSIEEVREELRPTAAERLVQSLVMGKIAEEENIEATAADIDARIEEMIQGAKNPEDMRGLFGAPQGRRYLWDRLMVMKTIERLVEIASGERAEAVETQEGAEEEVGAVEEVPEPAESTETPEETENSVE